MPKKEKKVRLTVWIARSDLLNLEKIARNLTKNNKSAAIRYLIRDKIAESPLSFKGKD